MSLSSTQYNQSANKNELNSFRKAVALNNKQSIEKHISHMKNLSEMELSTALFICIQNFRLEDQSDECLFLLLRNRANPNYELNGQTPLIAACKIAQLTMVKNLVENGAKPDLCNSEGKHPLEFILSARKENYDVAQYLISVISSVNIEIDKTHALVVTVEKEFARIFKMLVDKGATLTFNNQQTILHIIMKKKFKDIRKKKKFIKQLANRVQLSQSKDKFGKLPIQYESQDEIKFYYNEIFKPKQKPPVDKEIHHSRVKEKEPISKQVSKEKEPKKKVKEEEPSSAVEEEGVYEEENDEQGENHAINQEDDKERIVQVVQEQQQQKKVEEEKEKTKKTTSKILTPTPIINNKKNLKHTIKSYAEKSIIIEKPILVEKEKTKKINNDKKAKAQVPSKKNKSFISIKKCEVQDEKKEEEPPKKKLSVRSSSHRQEEHKKPGAKKQSAQIKPQNIKLQKKPDDELDQLEPEKVKISLTKQQQESIHRLLQELTLKAEQEINEQSQSQSSVQSQTQIEINLQQQLSSEILAFFAAQQKHFAQTRSIVEGVLQYLESKMKLCIQSHINHEFTFKMVLYGSQATGMAINESDIDFMIISNLSTQQLMHIFEFHQIFEEEEIVEFKFLKNATIPVIKLIFGPAFNNINVDITVMFGNHRGLRCVELMEEFKLAQPLLLPLVLTMKRLIYAYRLADPYTGGLSSYSLTLMTIALLQLTSTQKTHENIGKIFMEFLFFYGFQLDYVCQAIIIQPPFHPQLNSYGYQYFYNIYQLPNTLDLSSKLVIYDPLDPVNNVGRCTYRIQCLKNMLRVSYIRLKIHNLRIEDLLLPSFMELMQENY